MAALHFVDTIIMIQKKLLIRKHNRTLLRGKPPPIKNSTSHNYNHNDISHTYTMYIHKLSVAS